VWFAGGVTQDLAPAERLLRTPGRWALVGLSTNTARAAYGVAAYLQDLGHEIVPVHPSAPTVHGVRGYRTLGEVPGRIDVVDVFVNSSLAGSVIDQALALDVPAIWLQLGVHDGPAEARARAAGVALVTSACPAIEGRRLGVRPQA